MPKCLIIDDMHPAIFPFLEEVGFTIEYSPEIERNEVLQIVGKYEGIVVRSKLKLDKSFLAKANQLKFIARAGSGKDNIDEVEAEKLGIQLLNAPEGNRDAVAEHAIGLMLNLLNNIRIADQEVRRGIWNREPNRGTELGFKKVGIIGYGNTGRAISKKLASFGCEILAYDSNPEQVPEVGSRLVDMETIFAEAEILSLHIPLNEQNKHLVTKEFFARFAKPIWFVNTARGELVKTQDLIDALKTRKVLGAGLDVLENEKLEKYSEQEKAQFAELAVFPNVIFSPHIAGWTHESYRKISEVLGQKIKNLYTNNGRSNQANNSLIA